MFFGTFKVGAQLRAARSAADVSLVPAIDALLKHKANSALAEEHERKLQETNRGYSDAIGFHVLRWARNLASHHQWAADPLITLGLPVQVVDAAARAAATALCNAREHAGHVFRLNDKGVPVRMNARSRALQEGDARRPSP